MRLTCSEERKKEAGEAIKGFGFSPKVRHETQKFFFTSLGYRLSVMFLLLLLLLKRDFTTRSSCDQPDVVISIDALVSRVLILSLLVNITPQPHPS
jgi:hypothetical protein